MYICGWTLDPCPVITVLGESPSEGQFTVFQSKATAFVTLLARRLIFLHWKSARPPLFKCLVKEALSMMPLKKFRYSQKSSQDRSFKSWARFIELVQSMPFT